MSKLQGDHLTPKDVREIISLRSCEISSLMPRLDDQSLVSIVILPAPAEMAVKFIRNKKG